MRQVLALWTNDTVRFELEIYVTVLDKRVNLAENVKSC
jgi:hypothetical protein